MTSPDEARRVLDATCRSEYGRIVGVLCRVLGSLDEAEDVVQSACARALESWPRRGLPSSPGAWLTTVARRIAIDQVRRRRRGRSVDGELAAGAANEPSTGGSTAGGRFAGADPYDLLASWPDERLRLMFAVCHPDLDRDARLALTLREVCGLSTRQIARAFLASEATVAQRIVRAKRRLRDASVDFTADGPEAFPSRLDDVLLVVYLLFNEGYLARGGEHLMQGELCDEAVSLARLVCDLVEAERRTPDGEALGLLALLLLTHARREARADEQGLPVLLDDQDRSLWHVDEVSEGLAVLDRAVALRRPGPYQIKAAINAVHHAAVDAADTDWREILVLYDRLLAFEPTSVVRLNRAVAIGMVHGPADALAALDDVAAAGGVDRYPYFHLARARFLAALDRVGEAAAGLREARRLCNNESERRHIDRLIESLEG